jgi:trk system potassium uptake protein TrkA
MRTVIVGASRIGRALARRLIEDGGEVVLIDHSRDRLETVSNQLDCGMLCGDGTDPEILRDALAEQKSNLIAVTPEDQDNILSCLLAESLGYHRVLPRISRQQLYAICDELGLSERISPEEEVAGRLVEKLSDQPETGADSLQWPARVFSLAIHEDADFATVGDVQIPTTARAMVVYRGEQIFMATAEQDLRPGDRLSIATDTDGLAALCETYGVRDGDQDA